MLRRLARVEHPQVRALGARPASEKCPPRSPDAARLRALLTAELSRDFSARVTQLAARLGDATELVLHAHPADLAAIESLEVACPMTRVADPAITRGGCVLESAGGRLDATVETRVALLLAELEVAS